MPNAPTAFLFRILVFIQSQFEAIVRLGSVLSNGSWRLFFLIIMSGFFAKLSFAVELGNDIQIHGFLTQGYFLTSDNRMFGSSDMGGSFDFTESGLTALWSPKPDLRVAGQILFRRAGEGHEHDVEFDFGLVDYTFTSTPDYLLGVRVGRIKNPYGFYNETRDVLLTRPTILLPQSIYFDRTREVSLAADGAHLYGESRGDYGNLFFQLGMGIPRSEGLDSELSLLGGDQPGHLEPKLSYIGQIGYEPADSRYRLAISSAYVELGYAPKLLLPRDLPALKLLFNPVIFSAQYNADRFSLIAEYALRPFEQTVLANGLSRKVTGESFYLQGIYRLNQDWQAILRYDVLYNDRHDRNGKKYQAARGLPAYSRFAKDWTLGLRYHISANFMVAAEYHLIEGTAWLLPQDNPNLRESERHWSLFSIAASYRF